MSSLRRAWILTLLISWSSAHAEIFEADSITQVPALAQVDARTLFLTDLDLTVFRSSKNLGSDIWFEYLLKRFQERDGLSLNQAIEKAQPLFHAAQARIEAVAMEADTPGTFAELASRSGMALALTARNPRLSELTVRALMQVGIEPAAIFSGALDGSQLRLDHPAVIQQGIAYVGRNTKGQGLSTILSLIGDSGAFKPHRIVFIDDRLAHLQTVEAEAKRAGLEFVGIHYRHGKDLTRAFRARHPLRYGLARSAADARALVSPARHR